MGSLTRYDAVVVGAGAAGIFAARELGLAGRRVLLVERGRELDKRVCSHREGQGRCTRCEPCNILSGWGGAGAWSDGKLSLSPQVGGFLADILGMEETRRLLAYVDGVYLENGAPDEVMGADPGVFAALSKKADSAGLRLKNNPLRHMGTEHCRRIMGRMGEGLPKNVEVRFNAGCDEIFVEDGRVTGVRAGGKTIRSDFVVMAPGRVGAQWVRDMAQRLGLPTRPNPVDIGVRVECPASVADPMTEGLFEAKLCYNAPTYGDEVRTFCMNPRGEVVREVYEDILSVNGHSYAVSASGMTNFALLVKTSFTVPFDDPITYAKSVARLANLLSGGILVQRFSDLAAGRRSTVSRIASSRFKPTLPDAAPGDLSFALPHRHLVGIIEMMEALELFCPDITGPDTFLYGVEVKLYSNRLGLDKHLSTPIHGLYGAGDGVGVTRGLMQASASGVCAARSILAGGAA